MLSKRWGCCCEMQLRCKPPARPSIPYRVRVGSEQVLHLRGKRQQKDCRNRNVPPTRAPRYAFCDSGLCGGEIAMASATAAVSSKSEPSAIKEANRSSDKTAWRIDIVRLNPVCSVIPRGATRCAYIAFV